MNNTYLDANGWPTRGQLGPRVVALGGGHGLSATLRALRHITRNLTAVVTVADDGGSSGRLRQEFGILPPGDLRMALAALCDESEWGLTWRDVLQYRFDSTGPLDYHSLGNLLITGLWEILGDPVTGLDWVAKLLGAHGRVLPMANEALQIEADVEQDGQLHTIVGQSKVAVAPGNVKTVRLIPAHPVIPQDVFKALDTAQWIILGPGSWYTSLMPHLLIPQLRDAIVASGAKKALVVNLSRQKGETQDLTIPDHLRTLWDYAPDLRLDVVLADPIAIDDLDDLEAVAKKLGAQVLLRQISTGDGSAHHDPLRLAAAFRDAMEGYWGDMSPIIAVSSEH